MLYGCAAWATRTQIFGSLRIAHHMLILRVIGFRRSKEPVPDASKRQSARVNLGSPGPLFSTATQGSQSIYCLNDWRCKGPIDGVDRRRLRGTAYRKTSRPSERSRAEAKDANGSYSELLSRMDEIGLLLLRRTWACGAGGPRWGRKHLITPDDAWTSANPTCGASARLGDKGSPTEHRPTATA